MISDFTRKTSVVFDGTVTVDGVATALDANDIITLIVKESYDQTDAEAIITVIASHLVATGGVRFTLTPTITTVDAGDFYSEIKWVHDSTDVYILETTRITISKRIFD